MSGTIKRIIVAAGIIIIPLLYSYLYLGAFWDPYSRLDSLPVAVVNEDAGAVIQNEQRNLGNELITALQDDGTLKFVVTDAKDAEAGTEGSKYYAAITIPEDFSRNAASAETADKAAASITFSSNEKRNYLASQIMKSAVTQVEEQVRGKMDSEIVQGLSDQLEAVPGSLTQLSDGLGQLRDGSAALLSGTKDLAGGAADLSGGAQKADAGAKELASGAQSLAAGSMTLSSGAANLSDGADKLYTGTKLFAVNMDTFSKSLSDASAGSSELAAGAASLDTGIDSLLTGVQQLSSSTQNISQVTSGAASLAECAKTFNTGLNEYIAGVDSLIASVQSTSGFLTNYVTNINPSIMQDPYFAAFMQSMADPSVSRNLTALTEADAELKMASGQIAAGADALASGTADLPQINAALEQLETGLLKAQEGSASLSAGAAGLNAGLSQLDAASGRLDEASGTIVTGSSALSSGAAALSDGASRLSSGTSALSDGATVLSDGTADLSQGAAALSSGAASISGGMSDLSLGITAAKTGVDDSLASADSSLDVLNGLADYAASPASVESTPINAVPNYGTAFAPYFLSLSLWVGALMILLGTFMDTEGLFSILSRNSQRKYLRTAIYYGLGLVQAAVLGKVLEAGLGLHVNSQPLYYLACCLFSLTAVSIVQFFMVNCKSIGKFLCIVILILQLTSCGGTFPMETIPKIFNVLYPFMPMTYSVGLLKEAISGGDQTRIIWNASALLAFTAVFTLLSLLLMARDHRKIRNEKIDRIHA